MLENVTLGDLPSAKASPAICCGRPGITAPSIEEAYALLEALGLADEALRPVNELAYGRQRLVEIAVALGLKPKVLLLDEPAAGVPSGETGAIIDMIERLPADIALLIIEHDMDLVFRLAQRITVLVQGSVLVEGPPQEIAADPRVRAGLSRRARAAMSAGHGARPRARAVSRRLRRDRRARRRLAGAARRRDAWRCSAATASARPRCSATIMGHTDAARRHASALRGSDITALPPYRRARLGIGFVPQEREIFPLADASRRICRSRRGPAAGRSSAVYDFFPPLAERRRNRGNQLSGGEQQMLAIGRALMGNPSLLLMDEPLEGLAPVIVDALLAGLDRLKREDDLALLLVEQHARLALEFAENASSSTAAPSSSPAPAATCSSARAARALIGVAGGARTASSRAASQ